MIFIKDYKWNFKFIPLTIRLIVLFIPFRRMIHVYSLAHCFVRRVSYQEIFTGIYAKYV